MALIKRGLMFNRDMANRGMNGAMPFMNQPDNIEPAPIDLRKLERNLRKIPGCTRKAAKRLCHLAGKIDPIENAKELHAERAAAIKQYNQPLCEAKATLSSYTALCDAEEEKLFNEYEKIAKDNLLYDYYLINKNKLLGTYNEH